MKKINVVGNSHVMYFVGKPVPSDEETVHTEQNFEICAFKAGNTGATIYGLANPASTTGAGKKIFENVEKHKPENLVIVLGDVDFREHMPKHIKNGVDSYISDLMARYEKYISEKLIPNVSGKISVTQMVPFPMSYYMSKLEENPVNGCLYFYWSRFNEALEKLAKKNGWGLIRFDFLADDNNFLRKEFVIHPKEVHSNPRKTFPFIFEQLEMIYG